MRKSAAINSVFTFKLPSFVSWLFCYAPGKAFSIKAIEKMAYKSSYLFLLFYSVIIYIFPNYYLALAWLSLSSPEVPKFSTMASSSFSIL